MQTDNPTWTSFFDDPDTDIPFKFELPGMSLYKELMVPATIKGQMTCHLSDEKFEEGFYGLHNRILVKYEVNNRLIASFKRSRMKIVHNLRAL